MTTLYVIHATDADHLAKVREAMRQLGPPTVRVVDCGDCVVAIEGVHRLAAACELGLAPELIVLAQEALVRGDSLDWDDLSLDGVYPAHELAEHAWHECAGTYSIGDDGRLSVQVAARRWP